MSTTDEQFTHMTPYVIMYMFFVTALKQFENHYKINCNNQGIKFTICFKMQFAGYMNHE